MDNAKAVLLTELTGINTVFVVGAPFILLKGN
jgi:hypothetical protein